MFILMLIINQGHYSVAVRFLCCFWYYWPKDINTSTWSTECWYFRVCIAVAQLIFEWHIIIRLCRWPTIPDHALRVQRSSRIRRGSIAVLALRVFGRYFLRSLSFINECVRDSSRLRAIANYFIYMFGPPRFTFWFDPACLATISTGGAQVRNN